MQNQLFLKVNGLRRPYYWKLRQFRERRASGLRQSQCKLDHRDQTRLKVHLGNSEPLRKFEKLRSFLCHAGRRKGRRAQGGLVRWHYEEFGPRDPVQEHLQKYGGGIFWQKPDSSRGDSSEE